MAASSPLDFVIDPLDYQILDMLPPEGTLIFGAYPDGKTSQEIAQSPSVAEGKMPSSQIGNRMTVLGNKLGWVVKKKGIGTSNKHVWQRTKQGEKALHKWKGGQGGDNA